MCVGTWRHMPSSRHMAPCAFGRAHGKAALVQPPRKQENACVPHAAVLSACNSQRGHGLGLLTECLARHIAGSLGRPPRVRVIVLSLVCTERGTRATPPCTKGLHTRRGRRIPLHADDETGALLDRSGTAENIFLQSSWWQPSLAKIIFWL